MKNMVEAVMGVDRKRVVVTPMARLDSTRTMHLKEATEIGKLGQWYRVLDSTV